MNIKTRPPIYSQLPINEYEHSAINLQLTINQWIWTLDHQFTINYQSRIWTLDHPFTINYQSMNMNTQPLIYSQLPINEYEHSTINL